MRGLSLVLLPGKLVGSRLDPCREKSWERPAQEQQSDAIPLWFLSVSFRSNHACKCRKTEQGIPKHIMGFRKQLAPKSVELLALNRQKNSILCPVGMSFCGDLCKKRGCPHGCPPKLQKKNRVFPQQQLSPIHLGCPPIPCRQTHLLNGNPH